MDNAIISGLGRLAFRTLTDNGAKTVSYVRMLKQFKCDAKKYGFSPNWYNKDLWFAGATDERDSVVGTNN